jgi:outer membrane protein assembly factor BamB
MDPKLSKQDRNRGVALWNNLVISVTGYDSRVIATDKDSGQIVWDKNLLDQEDLELTAAPLALKDSILIGGSGGDRGLRNWLAALDPKTGEIKWTRRSGRATTSTLTARSRSVRRVARFSGGTSIRPTTTWTTTRPARIS